jgi:TolB-like protein/Flp pilus assembly protein TadD
MQESTQSRRAVKFGVFEADLAARELRKSGTKIRLQDQPFQVLALLLENPGQIVTREELRQKLWPADTFVDFDNGLNTAINKIREALGDSADHSKFIETLPRRGYRFIGAAASPAHAPARIESLVVLPLENLSRDPEQDYFADGLTEALITNLAKISALRVVSRTTAMHYKGVHRPLPEIARELGVDAAVEGTVLRSGKRVRICAQLLQATTDAHLWAEIYERDLRDILALQLEVARAIANEIRVKLTPQEQEQLQHSPPVNPEAYEAYLKGRYNWNKRSHEALVKGAEQFRSAIDLDPGYASAYAGLADSVTALGFWGHVVPEQGAAQGKIFARKALELDEKLAEAHCALGFATIHYDFDFATAEKSCRKAVELDPRSALAARTLSYCLVGTGHHDAGVAEALRAVQLEPYGLPWRWSASIMLYLSRQYDAAIAECRKTLDRDSNFAPVLWVLSLALLKNLKFEEAIAEAEKAVRVTGEAPFFLGGLGHCYAAAGRRDDMRTILMQLEAIEKRRYVSPYWIAMINAPIAEERDTVFSSLEAARREHAPWLAWMKLVPFFDDVRPDPRFDELLRRIFPSK